MPDTPKRKRRWFQFSLRSLLIFTVLCAIAVAWLGRKIEHKRREQAVVDGIRGGFVYYDYVDGRNPNGPRWLRSLLGENFFNEVWSGEFHSYATDESLKDLNKLPHLRLLRINSPNITDAAFENLRGLTLLQDLAVLDGPKITDVGLMNLKGLRNLQHLYLNHTKVTDSGLVIVKELSQLEFLSLYGTNISDAGLANLKGLKQLRTLGISDTKVTDAGVADLKKALPNCRIDH